jgi:hypothetical protein
MNTQHSAQYVMPGTTSAVKKSVRVRGVVLAISRRMGGIRVNVINNIIIIYKTLKHV